MKKIHNLDDDFREPIEVVFLGNKYDISFIPCGLSLPLLREYDNWAIEMNNNIDKIRTDPELGEKNLQSQARIVSIFTSYYYPEHDEEFILRHAKVSQVTEFMKLLVETIQAEYVTGKEDQKKTDKHSVINGKGSSQKSA